MKSYGSSVVNSKIKLIFFFIILLHYQISLAKLDVDCKNEIIQKCPSLESKKKVLLCAGLAPERFSKGCRNYIKLLFNAAGHEVLLWHPDCIVNQAYYQCVSLYWPAKLQCLKNIVSIEKPCKKIVTQYEIEIKKTDILLLKKYKVSYESINTP